MTESFRARQSCGETKLQNRCRKDYHTASARRKDELDGFDATFLPAGRRAFRLPLPGLFKRKKAAGVRKPAGQVLIQKPRVSFVFLDLLSVRTVNMDSVLFGIPF
jgi:hypothetical protein